MAAEIKALKCPQCGATTQQERKPGVYQCANCQTEYFLDDDDVTIHHRHEWVAPPAARPVAVRLLVGVLVVLGVVIAGSVALTGAWRAPAGASTAPRPPAGPAVDTEAFTWSSGGQALPVLARAEVGAEVGAEAGGARPLVLLAGWRRYGKGSALAPDDADPRSGLYLSLYDPLTGADTRTQRLELAPDAPARRYGAPALEGRVFRDGTAYLIVDKMQLFGVDPVTHTVREVTTTAFARHAALAAGIATMRFDQAGWGDGLELLTNDGGKYHYYPLIDQLYTDEAWYQATHAFTPARRGARPRTYYTFTGASFEFPDAPLELLSVRYLANAGGPEFRLENPSWRRDYGRSGMYHGNDAYRKVLISAHDQERSRILSFRNLTPGRRYFDPEVRYADSTALLITLRATAAPTAPLRLQCLDPQTGAIRWTTVLGPADGVGAFVRFGGGFVAVEGRRCTVYGADGKVRATRELGYQAAGL